MSFRDHFSGHAAEYSRYRPTYPDRLFEWLAAVAPSRRLAWDCGTGNGQAAVGLAAHFEQVMASDASAAQIANARAHTRVSYCVAGEQHPQLQAQSVDVVTVAQAVHWFDLGCFYAEVTRVLRPGGVLAVWSYRAPKISPQLDGVIDRLYRDIVGPYWPAERRAVEEGYRSIALPFEALEAPVLRMELRWDLENLVGYLNSWSSTRRYIAARGSNPVDQVRDELSVAWGPAQRHRLLQWPLHLKAGRVSAAVSSKG